MKHGLIATLYIGIYLLGGALLLIFLGAVSAGWFDRSTYLFYLIGVLVCLGLALIILTLLAFLRPVIQWMNTRMTLSSESQEEKDTPQQPAQLKETILSKEEARQWLDDFLVKQQQG